MRRIAADTLRCASVIAIAVAIATPRSAGAEDAAYDPTADLRLAARESAKPEERLTALDRVLSSNAPFTDPDLAARAAIACHAAPAKAGALLLRALESGEVRRDILTDEAAALRRLNGSHRPSTGPTSPPAMTDAFAYAVLLGVRFQYEVDAFTASPLSPFAAHVLLFDAPEIEAVIGGDPSKWPAPEALSKMWLEHVPTADAFDAAMADDPATSRKGMDALLADEARAYPFLSATAARGAETSKMGLVPRRVRAITILGVAKERRAVPDLRSFVANDRENGYVRVAAAYALGDVGDPSAVAGLCHELFYLGDRHRPLDSWDYPGSDIAPVSPEGWSDVEYYAIDTACCDALIRMGVRNAAGWLIRERLNPLTGRWRIRVMQDAVDAIRRGFESPITSYQPDAGLPDRSRATAEYLAWWAKGPKPKATLDENDPGLKAAAAEILKRVGEKSVMELQIAKHSAEMLGPAMTPTLLAHLPQATRKVERAELAAILGTVRDRRAVDPLLALTNDEVANVRAAAVESLAPYLDAWDDPLFAGTAKAGHAEIVARWLAMLDDDEAGPRASAMKALTVAKPDDAVRKAVEAHAAATHPDDQFGDYVMAEEIVTLVQTGEGLDKVLAHLSEIELFKRRFVWELLRAALDLDPLLFNPTPDPGTPSAKPIDAAVVRAALAKRRGA